MNDMTQGALVPIQTDDEIIDVLVNSLYPGAKRDSAAMVLSYCRAAGLDPLQKPVHIVPMSVKTGMKNKYGRDEYVMRDVVMPGVGLYRVQASRTGQYAGMDEPVLGPMHTMTFADTKTEWVAGPNGRREPKETYFQREITYPEWVTVTVYRLVGGFRCAFPAREYWLENYATAGRDTEAPNTMWAKRTIGQLVKCAEAQALRKGFPEVGSQPTAEEMEGRAYPETFEAEPTPVAAPMPRRVSEAAPAPAALTDETINQQPMPFTPPAAEAAPVERVEAPAPAPAAQAPTPAPAPAPAPAASSDDSPAASDGQKMNVKITAQARKVDLRAILIELGSVLDPETLDGLTQTQFKALKAKLA